MGPWFGPLPLSSLLPCWGGVSTVAVWINLCVWYDVYMNGFIYTCIHVYVYTLLFTQTIHLWTFAYTYVYIYIHMCIHVLIICSSVRLSRWRLLMYSYWVWSGPDESDVREVCRRRFRHLLSRTGFFWSGSGLRI